MKTRSVRRWKLVLVIVAVLAVAAGAYLVGHANGAANAGAASATTSTPIKVRAFYLDMGASESLGFQPTGIPHHNGARTDTGYANDLVLREALKGVALTLEQIGCPGDTIQSLLDTTKSDACYQAPDTQLTKAEAYLQAHRADQVLVTVDLGFNNVRPCMEADPVNQTCLSQAIVAIQRDLPIVLKDLKSSAGPNVHFIGVDYADPYLGYYVNPSVGAADATATLVGMDRLDGLLDGIYASAGVPVANVPALFQTNNDAVVTVPNVGTIPTNVQQACELTWFCYTTPFGPDDHPNDAGYSLIAEAIEAVLPRSWS